MRYFQGDFCPVGLVYSTLLCIVSHALSWALLLDR